MKQQIEQLITASIAQLISTGELAQDFQATVLVTPSKDSAQGDFASNVALACARSAGMAPRQFAELLLARMAPQDWLQKVEIAGPGFINFFLNADVNQSVVQQILQQQDSFGHSDFGNGQRVQIEYVSANPTGPLHVGHGRGAAYGATLSNLLKAVGYDVSNEYYVNDAGRQMDILGVSVWLRYLELAGESLTFPSNGYQGDYVWDIAATLHRENGDAYRKSTAEVFDNVSADAPEGDKELHIDDLIANAKKLLGAEAYRVVFDLGLNTLVDVIRVDLQQFGVEFDEWFSERQLTEQGIVDKALQTLQDKGQVYEQEGAL